MGPEMRWLTVHAPVTLTTCCWRLWTTTSRRPADRRCARLSPRATWRSSSRLTT
jgi:hypothetical protein